MTDANAPTPEQEEENEARQRLVLPLLIPASAFLFAVLLIYGLSRIYLDLATFEVGGDVNLATPLAIVVALAILGVAWYLAAHPEAGRWQLMSIGAVAVILLVGGGIWSAIYEEEAEEEAVVGEETATPPDGNAVSLGDNFFEYQGVQAPTISVSAGESVTWDLDNEGIAVHNLHFAGIDNSFETALCETDGDEPCSDPNSIAGGETGTVSFQFDEVGTFEFRCDFHPIEMVGTVVVE